MTTDIHLTDALQKELDIIGSSLILQTETNSRIKINSKDWAYAKIDDRSLQASCYVGLQDKHLQLEEKGIISCTSSTRDISEMASIADKWVAKKINVWDLAKQHYSIRITDKYKDLLTLSDEELIENRWLQLMKEIEKGHIAFRPDVFKSFKAAFSGLYPYFSHDNLWFSDVIESSNGKFTSPVIICKGDTIEVGLPGDNSPTNNHFKTKETPLAINKTKELLPLDFKTAINPLKSNYA